MAFKYGQIAIAAANATERRRAQQAAQQQAGIQQFMMGLAAIKKKQDDDADQKDWMNVLEGYDPGTNTFLNNATRPNVAQKQMELRLKGFQNMMELKRLALETKKANVLTKHTKAMDALAALKHEEEQGEKAAEKAKAAATLAEITQLRDPTMDDEPPDVMEDRMNPEPIRPQTVGGIQYEDARRERNIDRGIEERKLKLAERAADLADTREARLERQMAERLAEHKRYTQAQLDDVENARAKVEAQRRKDLDASAQNKYEFAVENDEQLKRFNWDLRIQADPRVQQEIYQQINRRRSELKAEAYREAARQLGLKIYEDEESLAKDLQKTIQGALKGPDDAE